MAALAPAYLPRRPTETVLYRTVRENLETFLAHARETYERPLPQYVEQELRAYLRCGVFAHGFARLRCETCRHDLLVAYSCKGRGICPSCAGRRMANCAAHLVDRVVPDVPLRQYVLSLPHELRRLAAFKQDVLGALVKIFIDAVTAGYRARAKREGIEGAEVGAITFLQRFGGSLNLNLHLHVAFLDGVFTRDERKQVQFHPACAPDAAELDAIARRVHWRATAWLRRHHYIEDKPLEARSNEMSSPGAIEACADIAMQRGVFAVHFGHDGDSHEATGGEPPKLRFAAQHEGFNLHAGVHIAAGDDTGRERLFRYGARPSLALDRLRRLPDGRIAYRVKYARAGRAKHRVMEPLELLARIAAILPPPRFPLVRFHGVLAPRSSWRKDVVPQPRERKPRPLAEGRRGTCDEKLPGHHAKATGPTEHRAGSSADGPASANTPLAKAAALAASRPEPQQPVDGLKPPTRRLFGSDAAILLAPSILAVAHWDRLMGGLLYAVSTRLPWAQLLRRTFALDVQQCPKCAGRLRLIQNITQPAVAQAILERLGMPTEAPTAARARDPTEADVGLDDRAE